VQRPPSCYCSASKELGRKWGRPPCLTRRAGTPAPLPERAVSSEALCTALQLGQRNMRGASASRRCERRRVCSAHPHATAVPHKNLVVSGAGLRACRGGQGRPPHFRSAQFFLRHYTWCTALQLGQRKMRGASASRRCETGCRPSSSTVDQRRGIGKPHALRRPVRLPRKPSSVARVGPATLLQYIPSPAQQRGHRRLGGRWESSMGDQCANRPPLHVVYAPQRASAVWAVGGRSASWV
jgi:hypothetical protein